jgi:hypothetical protein
MHVSKFLPFLSRLTSHERENHLSGFDESRHRYSLGALSSCRAAPPTVLKHP